MVKTIVAAGVVFGLLAFAAIGADDVKPTEEGKGAEFKAKKMEMKEQGEVAYLLSFDAGKEFDATTDGTKETDIYLYVYDEAGKEVGKDTTTGPKCSVKITPAKAGKYMFLIKNVKGGNNTVTFDVKVAK